MNNTIISISLALLLAAPAFAQLVVRPPPPSVEESRAMRRAMWEAQRAKTQKLWDEYRINPGRAGHKALAEIAAQGAVPGTKNNTSDVLRLLEGDGTSEDRRLYARIAGDLHADLGRENDKTLQRDVQEALARVIKNDKDAKVRKAAMFAYSRMGYFPDSIALLKQSQPLLGDRDFHGELAHMLLSAPADGQLKIIAEMASGEGRNNDFGKEILASQLREERALARVAPTSAQPLLKLLAQEPGFPAQPDTLGVMLAAGYAEWFGAVVGLTAKSTGEAPRFVVARLLKLDGDPRKLVSVFSDEHSAALVRPALARRDLEQIDAALAAYAARHSANTNIQGFVRMSRSNIAEPATSRR